MTVKASGMTKTMEMRAFNIIHQALSKSKDYSDVAEEIQRKLSVTRFIQENRDRNFQQNITIAPNKSAINSKKKQNSKSSN